MIDSSLSQMLEEKNLLNLIDKDKQELKNKNHTGD